MRSRQVLVVILLLAPPACGAEVPRHNSFRGDLRVRLTVEMNNTSVIVSSAAPFLEPDSSNLTSLIPLVPMPVFQIPAVKFRRSMLHPRH